MIRTMVERAAQVLSEVPTEKFFPGLKHYADDGSCAAELHRLTREPELACAGGWLVAHPEFGGAERTFANAAAALGMKSPLEFVTSRLFTVRGNTGLDALLPPSATDKEIVLNRFKWVLAEMEEEEHDDRVEELQHA